MNGRGFMRRIISTDNDLRKIVSIIKSFKEYQHFQAFIRQDFPEIILKSDEIEEDERGIRFYPKIDLQESTYANDYYDENVGVWYGRRLVKMNHEMIVPCVPMLRIFFRQRYITVTTNNESIFDLLCNQIISKIEVYENISINKPNIPLQWIGEEKNIFLEQGIPFCRIHQHKLKKQREKSLSESFDQKDLCYEEEKAIYFPNCQDPHCQESLLSNKLNLFQRQEDYHYICKECDKQKKIWLKKQRENRQETHQ